MPAYDWRPLDPSDALRWAELLRTADVTERPARNLSVSAFTSELDVFGASWNTDTLGAFNDETLVGYCLVRQVRRGGTGLRYDLEGFVHPEHRRCGLGGRLVDWSIARARDRAAGRTHRIEAAAVETDVGHRALLTSRGLLPTRSWLDVYSELDTVAEMPVPALPDGMRVARFEERLSDAVRDVHNDAFGDHDHDDGVVDGAEWNRTYVRIPPLSPETSFVVLDDADRVLSYVLCYAIGEDDDTGVQSLHVGYLGTPPAFRGHSLYRVLLRHVDRAARDLGFDGMEFTIDEANPSGIVRLLTRMGLYDEDRDEVTVWFVHAATVSPADAAGSLTDTPALVGEGGVAP